MFYSYLLKYYGHYYTPMKRCLFKQKEAAPWKSSGSLYHKLISKWWNIIYKYCILLCRIWNAVSVPTPLHPAIIVEKKKKKEENTCQQFKKRSLLTYLFSFANEIKSSLLASLSLYSGMYTHEYIAEYHSQQQFTTSPIKLTLYFKCKRQNLETTGK